MGDRGGRPGEAGAPGADRWRCGIGWIQESNVPPGTRVSEENIAGRDVTPRKLEHAGASDGPRMDLVRLILRNPLAPPPATVVASASVE